MTERLHRRTWAFLLSHLLLACGSQNEVPRTEPPRPAPEVEAPRPAEPPYARTEEPTGDGTTYSLHRFSFALSDIDVSIVDLLPDGRVPPHVALSDMPQKRLGALRQELGARLVINAGYYDPEFAPEGLLVNAGVTERPVLPRLGGGVLTISSDHVARLFATEEFVMPEHTVFAVQCSPRLIVDGAVNIRRDDGQRAARTALCIREGGRRLDVIIARADQEEAAGRRGPSLFALAHRLVELGCESALNLDGGPSTGVAHDDFSIENPRPVREALVVRSR